MLSRNDVNYKAWWGICFLMIAPPVFSEDLLGVYRKALQSDPQLLGAEYAHAAAGEGLDEAVGRMVPQLGFEYSGGRTQQDTLRSDIAYLRPLGENDYSMTEYSLTLTQPVFNWGFYTSYKQAKSEMSRADADFNSKQQDLILRVVERYLEILAAEDEIGFAESEKAAVYKQLELLQGLMKRGLASTTELYDAQARYANVEAKEIAARSHYDDQLQALREIVGSLAGDLATLKPDIALVYPEPRDPGSWMKAALVQNPRVISQMRAVDVSRYEVALQRAGHIPTLDFTARSNNIDTDGSLSGGGSKVETRELLLRLKVPLFQGGVVSSRIRRSHHLHQKGKQDLIEVQRSAQRAARSGYYGLISAISKVKALDKSVKSQDLALQAKQRGYLFGLFNSIDVLDAERDAYEAKRNHSRARYDYLLYGLRLKHSVGTLSGADINGINLWLE